ncbi:DUF1778 domain-containing protein [Antribacter gilvus]|uniref:type II toxin -antitoxin system TacA 1-like antitoxin n=1 Tax=Antribacter gilvus TaxID=2304675 RepID=UPI000F7A62BF|nr:DUF1778 domain-containing protein [Antribacter gilvus]
MTVRKLSISVPPEVEELIKAAAEAQGTSVSAWLADAAVARARQAARDAQGVAAAEALLAEAVAEHGGQDVVAYRSEARDLLRRNGLLGDAVDDFRSAG